MPSDRRRVSSASTASTHLQRREHLPTPLPTAKLRGGGDPSIDIRQKVDVIKQDLDQLIILVSQLGTKEQGQIAQGNNASSQGQPTTTTTQRKNTTTSSSSKNTTSLSNPGYIRTDQPMTKEELND